MDNNYSKHAVKVFPIPGEDFFYFKERRWSPSAGKLAFRKGEFQDH